MNNTYSSDEISALSNFRRVFYILALTSMAGYVLQSTLLVRFGRQIDPRSLVFYRSLTLGITLLPLLLVLRRQDLIAVMHQPVIFGFAGILGALYLWCTYTSMRSLPVGSNSALIAASATVSVLLFGMFTGAESLSWMKQCAIGLIVVSSLLLGFSQPAFAHLDGRLRRGIILTIIAGIPGAGTKILLGMLTTTMHPFVAGYFWEISIGMASALLLGASSWTGTGAVHRIPVRTLFLIMACSAPTLVGTGAFALALPLGSLSVLQAIGSGGSIVLSGLISHVLYHEHMTRRQWVPIFLIASAIAALKILG